MPTVKINLARAERTVLPEDEYQARIVVAELRTSRQGNPALHLELLTEGNENSTLDNVRLFRDQGMGEESAFYLAELARAIYGDIEGDAEGEFELNTDDMMDVMVGVRVSIDASFDGRERNRIDAFFNADDFGAEEFIDGEGEEEEEEATV